MKEMTHSDLVRFLDNHHYLNGDGTKYRERMLKVVSEDPDLEGHELFHALNSIDDFVDFFEDANPPLKKRHLKQFFWILRAGAQTLEHASFILCCSSVPTR